MLHDEMNRLAYATDASPYYSLPQAIARPRSTTDCRAALAYARERGWSVTPRGAGTSLAGQAIGTGLIVDTSRYMDRIEAVDATARWAEVQPGVVIDHLNRQVRAQGLYFAPDPSTYTRCTFGGLIGNNAWGGHAPRDGTTRDHVNSIELLLSDGTLMPCTALSAAELTFVLAREDRVGMIYRTVIDEVQTQRENILRRFPDPDRVPCNMGYALHVLARMQPFCPTGAPFNLAALITGSEGTLGLITQARIRLSLLPPQQVVIAAHYHTVDAALTAVAPARAVGASAVELLDRVILDLSEHNLEQRKHRHWLVERPGAVVLIELNNHDEHAMLNVARQLQEQLRAMGAFAAPLLHPPHTDDAWAVRRAGLGLLMGLPGVDKPVTLIEDSAVPIEHLVPFYRDVNAFMAKIGKSCVYYGSIGMGLLHLRPLLNLATTQDRDLMDVILRELSGLIRLYGGALSAKHGDGRLRGPYVKDMLGAEMVASFQRIKLAFDPESRFNPDVIFTTTPVTSGLRAPLPEQKNTSPVLPLLHHAPRIAAASCHGAGVCRRIEGEGAMCPSYRATHDETSTTRARANVLRGMMTAQGAAGLASESVHAALDLCLSCKACRRECPANVDMARAKVAHLQAYYQRHGVPLRAHAIANLHWYARAMKVWPGAISRIANSAWLKRALRLHTARALPSGAMQPFSTWFNQSTPPTGDSGQRVVVLNDVFTEYFEPVIGQNTVQLLRAMGCEVRVSPCFPSVRAALSQGLVSQASARMGRIARWIEQHTTNDELIIGLEPSEILMWRDEAEMLAPNEQQRAVWARIGQRALVFEEFLDRHGAILFERLRSALPRKVWVHVHCHQKALSDATLVPSLLRRVPGLDVQVIASGCCGMAGAFGYEQEHFDLSQAVAELVLLPTLRQAQTEDWIVATGTSCRQQIADGVGRSAQHVAQVLAACLADSVSEPRRS